ncbi:SRPBCC domain-containing protein [Flavihumibacter sediminis]|nr:SRPBCC domain-containing protein [Flavihumibacter sediminis]
MPIIIEQKFGVPAETIWKAITEPEAMKQWYFTIPGFKAEEGAVFEFYEPGEEHQYLHRCTITRVEPMKLLQHTWTHPHHSKGSSLLTWELVPEGDSTLVKLTHEGIENLADAGPAFAPENYQEGWNQIIGESLKNYLLQ